MKKILLLTAIVAFFNPNSLKGQSTWQFLDIPATPRLAATGNVASLLEWESDAFLSNPAFIQLTDEGSVEASYTRYVADIQHGTFLYTDNLPLVGKVGLFANYMNYGEIPRTDELGNENGKFEAMDLVTGLTAGYKFTDEFRSGATIKWVYSGIDNYSSYGIAADAGLFYYLNEEKMYTGLVLRNAGFQLKGYRVTEEIPTKLSLQISKTLRYLPITLGGELSDLVGLINSDTEILDALILSGKIQSSKAISLYLSAHLGRREDLKTTGGFSFAGMSGGITFRAKSFTLNYAYSNMGVLEGVHRIGIGFLVNTLSSRIID